jgi:formylglycine-generating enzyme required for sulfatase activity
MKTISILFSGLFIFVLLSANYQSKPKRGAKQAMKVLDGFCEYVPSGNAVYDGDTVSVAAFYMSKNEITNLQYLEFLTYLKNNGRMEDYKKCQVDSLGWRMQLGNNQKMTDYYHRHPAYHNYPVVNVSKESAIMYCDWLTEMYDSLSNGELKIKFRVPFRAEFLRAARGDNHQHRYSWGGPFLRNSEGTVLANFLRFGSEHISRDPETGVLKIVKVPIDFGAIKGSVDVTAPVESYWPSEYGFYNLNGNVSEMIADSDHAVGGDWYSPGYDIRNESIKPFDEPSPTVGFRVVTTFLNQEK